MAVCAGEEARPGRFELPTTGSVDQCSIQLSYGRRFEPHPVACGGREDTRETQPVNERRSSAARRSPPEAKSAEQGRFSGCKVFIASGRSGPECHPSDLAACALRRKTRGLRACCAPWHGRCSKPACLEPKIGHEVAGCDVGSRPCSSLLAPSRKRVRWPLP